jgi:hypothetical protein
MYVPCVVYYEYTRTACTVRLVVGSRDGARQEMFVCLLNPIFVPNLFDCLSMRLYINMHSSRDCLSRLWNLAALLQLSFQDKTHINARTGTMGVPVLPYQGS